MTKGRSITKSQCGIVLNILPLRPICEGSIHTFNDSFFFSFLTFYYAMKGLQLPSEIWIYIVEQHNLSSKVTIQLLYLLLLC